MKFYQLDSFIAVVEERSFTRAAERVFRTQPTVSLAIKRLEEDMGVPLLARDGNDWSLTEPGRLMLKYARQLTDLRDEAQRALSEFNDLTAGSVSIAAHESGAQYMLPAPIAAFHKRFPKIRIEMRICGVSEVGDMVSARMANIGFGVIQHPAKTFRADVLLADPLLLVVPPGHRLTRLHQVSIEDLSQELFVVHHLQTATSDRIWRVFRERGVEFNVIAELWNFEAVKRFVLEDCGIVIIPRSVVWAEIEAEKLVALPVRDFELIRNISVVSLDEELLPGAQALHDLLVEWDWEARSGTPTAPTVINRS
jgi:DNA-binding transcriptional LysR family regulator